MNSSRIIAVEALIKGKVQGVFFRAFTQKAAKKLGLTGYVENLGTGKVHLIAVGPEKAVDSLLELLRQGPKKAEVDRIDSADIDPAPKFPNFEIR